MHYTVYVRSFTIYSFSKSDFTVIAFLFQNKSSSFNPMSLLITCFKLLEMLIHYGIKYIIPIE